MINEHHVDSILEVHNSESNISSYYDILAPLQLTLEYCRGTSTEDFHNILMVSPKGTYFHTFPVEPFLKKFNDRTLHHHNYFELLIVLEGEVIQQIEDKEILYTAGTCCLTNRNIRHKEKFIGEAKVLFLGISTSLIKELIDSHKTAFFQEEKKYLKNSILKFIESDIQFPEQKAYIDFFPTFQNKTSSQELHKIADLLTNTLLMPKYGSTYMIKGFVCQLFEYLNQANSYHATPVKLNSNADFLLFSRIGHLLEDTNGRMTRSELEEVLNYSGNYLNSIVVKYTGLCLFDYGMTFCLSKAESLLSHTDQSISSIMNELNFYNRTHFYKLFKEKHGMTPNEYRKKHLP